MTWTPAAEGRAGSDQQKADKSGRRYMASDWRHSACGLALMGWLAFAPSGCGPRPQPDVAAPGVVLAMNQGVSQMGQYLYEDAVRTFEGVVRDAPELLEARVNLAIALFNRNRQEDLAAGGKLLEEVLQKQPDHLRALYFQAIVFQHVGKAEQAIPNLEKVLKSRPEDGAAWYLLGLCKQRTGQTPEAELLKAIALRPYLYSAYYQLYQLCMRGGKDEQARSYLERFKALRESPLGESLEFPQYNQMGELALALPLGSTQPPPIAQSQARFDAGVVGATISTDPTAAAHPNASADCAVAAADLNGDGRVDLVVTTSTPGALRLLRQGESGRFQPGAGGGFQDVTVGSGLDNVSNAVSCAIADFDNDEHPDLGVATVEGLRLLRSVEGRFVDVTSASGILPAKGEVRSVLFLDADHDGDLDAFVCGKAGNQLWNNNGDGTFTDIAAKAGVECIGGGSVQVLAADLDGDRDMDLVVVREDGPARVFLNELLGAYRPVELDGVDIRGDAGAVLQDVNGDGAIDLVALGGNPRRLQLWLGDDRGGFRASQALAGVSQTIDSWGPQAGFRLVDVDLDGDLDVLSFGKEAHLLLNDGRGRFVVQAQAWKAPSSTAISGLESFDLTGDLVPDLVVVVKGQRLQIYVAPGNLTPPSTALAILPSGVRSRDGRTRSPASGYGVRLTMRAALREQRLVFSGQNGGRSQSFLPVVLGLSGAQQADYVQLAWPDGVAQVETALAGARSHKIAELQRKISSCPVLFAWNGKRFEFITDFAGVGGLGYFSAPGVSAPPQVREHVKIEAGQLQPRDGFYELRVTEPMEESAYLDQLELLAIDHPDQVEVFPDERLAITGAPPTHELLMTEDKVFPVRALDPDGRDCTASIAKVDRVYAYEPELDRRYVGFCRPHTLELDFGDRLRTSMAGGRLWLFLNGYIEYPYSQTVYAAAQSRVGWEPIRIEACVSNDVWTCVIADAGVPGGMARMMTVDLGGVLPAGTSRLRLTSNLEVYYDQVYVAPVRANAQVKVRSVRLQDADLRYAGFAREYSPDGREPLIYDYQLPDATAPFHRLKGAYTRYGPVGPLMAEFDDQYVVMGPGDEVALRFDARALPPLPAGYRRSFVMVSHAYCKDMDLYTATPQTLEPLPFKSMSRYPYPATERYPDTPSHRRYQAAYNTRLVE